MPQAQSQLSSSIHLLPFSLLLTLVLPVPALFADQPESCEFRVVQWNASGTASNDAQDLFVAATLRDYVVQIDANVVTAQEITDLSLTTFESLLPGWNCHGVVFGADNNALCVDGTPENPSATMLTPDPNKPDPTPPALQWWGYVQAEYLGALITSVHTRSFWRNHHRAELHADVPSGVSGGDFNHIDAFDPGWFQTDLAENFTFEGDYRGTVGQWKIDHVFSIDEPLSVSGGTGGYHGSNHKVVLAEITYTPEEPSIAVAITNPQQPIEVDGSCEATIEFEVAIHDNCCLDVNALALVATAINPTANATLGPVSIDSVTAVGARDVEATGHVEVSALESCPAELTIQVSAQDCAGNVADSASQTTSASVSVLDTTPPAVVENDSDLYCLWPPNHAYVCFEDSQFSPAIADNCAISPSWTFDSCTSSQPDNGRGDGNTIDDCIIDSDDQGFCARSERRGSAADGRRYESQVRAKDSCGNASAAVEIGKIYVPRDQDPALTCVAPGTQ